MSKKMILVDPDMLFGSGVNRGGGNTFNEVKIYKKFKKLLKEEEDEKKKDKPKETGFMKDWSLAKRTAFFALAGPPLGIGYIFGLVILVRGLALFIINLNTIPGVH